MTLGRYAQIRRKFLKEHHKIRYLQSSDELHPDTAFGGNRADSDEAGRNPDEADGGAGGLDREPESGGYDKVVQGMNNLRNRVQEIVKAEVIFA